MRGIKHSDTTSAAAFRVYGPHRWRGPLGMGHLLDNGSTHFSCVLPGLAETPTSLL